MLATRCSPLKKYLSPQLNDILIMFSAKTPRKTPDWTDRTHWRGVPLETHEIVVNLVSSTRTSTGLEVHCRIDEGQYTTGRKVTDKEMNTIRLKRNAFHGDWNYESQPHKNHSFR